MLHLNIFYFFVVNFLGKLWDLTRELKKTFLRRMIFFIMLACTLKVYVYFEG